MSASIWRPGIIHLSDPFLGHAKHQFGADQRHQNWSCRDVMTVCATPAGDRRDRGNHCSAPWRMGPAEVLGRARSPPLRGLLAGLRALGGPATNHRIPKASSPVVGSLPGDLARRVPRLVPTLVRFVPRGTRRQIQRALPSVPTPIVSPQEPSPDFELPARLGTSCAASLAIWAR